MTFNSQRKFMLGGVAVLALTVFSGSAQSASAATMRGATSVTTNMGNLGADVLPSGASSPNSMIDKAGLYRPYTNGQNQASYLNVIDGDESTYGALHSDSARREWFSAQNVTTGNIDFNLGNTYTIENVVIWNEDVFGIKDFNVFASNNAAFTGATNLGAFTARPQAVSGVRSPQFIEEGKIYGFTPTAAQFIRLVVRSTYDYETPNRDILNNPDIATNPGFRSASIGEVAFGETDKVPTPALLPGLIGLGATAWRKRRQLATQ
jgi:hypothetical protein